MIVLSTKLKNELKKYCPTAVFKIKDISINGDKRGCSGFVTLGDKTIYLTTESANDFGFMYRAAAHDRDFRGGRNIFVRRDYENNDTLGLFAKQAAELLAQGATK